MASESEALSAKIREFKANVWDHTADEFQSQFDLAPPIAEEELDAFESIIRLSGITDFEAKSSALRSAFLRNTPTVERFLQMIGWTRNKILQDVKARARRDRLVVSVSTPTSVVTHGGTWQVAAPILIHRMDAVFSTLVGHVDKRSALAALNEATWPGYIRQERAKRQGHEAEYRLAVLMSSIGIPFEPTEKAQNPLGRDAQIRGVSFDLVVPSTRRPRLCFKSTVHTANIGQYGESKDDLEMRQAKEMLTGAFAAADRPRLMALADGVGFESNRQGLDGVLVNSDEFCQFQTIWKAAVVAAAVTDRKIIVVANDSVLNEHRPFLDRYRKSIDSTTTLVYDRQNFTIAGNARVRVR